MGKKCCMGRAPRDMTQKRVALERKSLFFIFPSEKTEPENRQKWIQICRKVRQNLEVGMDTGICELHWPENYPTYSKKGHVRPAVPPSIFPDIPASIVPDPLPSPRVTSRSSNQVRNTLADELDCFQQLDLFSYDQLIQELVSSVPRQIPVPCTCFTVSNSIHIQSLAYFHGIPQFMLVVSDSLQFECFHLGVKVHLAFLSRNRVTQMNRWSILN